MENPVVAGVLVALIVPFLGNTLGAALVFLMACPSASPRRFWASPPAS